MQKLIFLEDFGKAFVPKKVRPNLRSYFLKAGFNSVPYKLFGVLVYVAALLTMAVYLLFLNKYIKGFIDSSDFLSSFSLVALLLLSFLSFLILLSVIAIVFMLLIYFVVDLRIFGRTKQIEDMFPDYLQVVASNLKGGLTFENALWAAIKPQFKILASEMAEVSKKVMTGYSVKDALRKLSDKYDSSMLKRSMDLLISEHESGGNVAELLDHLVGHLKQTRELKEEMSANAITYVIFISIIIMVVSPLLFVLAFNLLTIILNFVSGISSATAKSSGLPFKISKGNVDPEDFKIFSIATIMTISFFASLIVSTVEKGNVKSGLKYIPMFVTGSLAFYLIFSTVLTGFFQSMFF